MNDGDMDFGSWMAGSPWRDMRLHSALQREAGVSKSMIPVQAVSVLNRNPEWILTEDGDAGLTIPATRTELTSLPADSARIFFSQSFTHGDPWAKVVCRDRQLESVFLRFCESVLSELVQGAATTDALHQVLERFRLLFEQRDSPVPTEKIVGLFAELSVLAWLLESGVDALPGWLGPLKETHDFVFGKNHVEVKALSASGERKFRVANIHQLEAPEDGNLFVVGVRVSPGLQTVETVFERVKGLLRSMEEHEMLEKAMSAAGCSIPVDSSWNAESLMASAPETWLVEEGFPRLIPDALSDGELPKGVSEVRYSVSLESATAHFINPSDVLRSISNSNKE